MLHCVLNGKINIIDKQITVKFYLDIVGSQDVRFLVLNLPAVRYLALLSHFYVSLMFLFMALHIPSTCYNL